MRYQDIFVPGGFPRLTYNPRADLQLEERLGEIRENLCKLATITGHTKAGKTVLARKVLPREEALWIDGGTVSAEEDFWEQVVQGLDLFQVVEEEQAKEATSALAGKAAAEANLTLAKGKGEIGATLGRSRSQSERRSRNVSAQVTALAGLRKTSTPLVVDDFHYLPRNLQGQLIRALKPLVFEGVPIAVIAIPHRRYDAVKVEREMAGRITSIEIPSWSHAELAFIPQTGFQLLGYSLSPADISRLSGEAIGSPHLMQDFCRGICKRFALDSEGDGRQLALTPADITPILQDVADTIGRPIFEKLARGPRSRTERIARRLKSGREVDIYQLVLHALAHIRPGLVSLEYEDLRAAIRDVSAEGPPQLQEVARVLKHMATIAASDQSSTPVIDFEEDEKKLHITDPFFAFYLRWGELNV